ncbi:ATPase, T2SS/T4P/T4SS family [Sphaerotilus sp.]|uniref:ATPase, T2SS/T4P/T4SS family n=1 Tax=Sphaerotilus sp. TaxID=2093942 RepID=UPI0034E2E6C1
MSEQEQTRMLAQEQAERVVQRLMRRYSADTHRPMPPSTQDGAFRDWLGLASGMPPAELTRASVEQADTRLIPMDVSRQRLCVALRAADGAIALVLADPFDRDHRLWLEARLRDAGHPRTRWYITPVQALLGFIDRIEQTRRTDEALRTGVRQPGHGRPTETAALRHINDMLRQALGAHATHLHWLQAEPAPDDKVDPASGVWQMRVEGSLRRTAAPETPGPSFDAVFEALQAAATRDGHLPVVHAGRQWTAHITVLQRPLPDGNVQRAAVLRLPVVAVNRHPPGLDELGHDSGTLERLRHSLQLAHGLWLVVSPPGAGKSETLQALGRELGACGQRVLRLVRPTVPELASALAQDPDRLLIDELDTPEAAARLVDEALSGRPVVLSVAAPDPWSALMRLERLGVSAPVLAVTLKGVLMQSLLRLNCPSCSRPVASWHAGQPPSVRGTGCQDCDHTGHMGRQVISRWLALTPPLADLLTTPAPHRPLQAAAGREGYAGLQDAALEWVTAGLVSREEARRVAAMAV